MVQSIHVHNPPRIGKQMREGKPVGYPLNPLKDGDKMRRMFWTGGDNVENTCSLRYF